MIDCSVSRDLELGNYDWGSQVVATSYRLRILHVSDLHLTPRDEDPWRQLAVLGEDWGRRLDEVQSDAPVDIVCFTGDAAQAGKPDEYVMVTQFLRGTLERLGLTPDRFYAVPGNHDVDRTVAAMEWKSALEVLPTLGTGAVSDWVAGWARSIPVLTPELRDSLIARQAAWREWIAKDMQRPQLLPDAVGGHPLGFRQLAPVDHLPFPVQIIGLNSAWLCGADGEAGRLQLTDCQIGRLATIHGHALSGFRIAMVHHPFSDLADGRRAFELLADRVDILLRGHLHETDIILKQTPDHDLQEFATGCLYQRGHGDRYPNAFTVIDAVLDSTGRPYRYELWFHGWSPRGFWHDDASLYRDAHGGRLSIIVRPEPELLPAQGHFVGRTAELERLATALLPADGLPQTVAVCAVQGMPGVGKSFLVDRFAALHADGFPGGYFRIALDPRGGNSIAMLLGDLARRLQVPRSNLAAALQRRHCLVHIENADDVETARTAADVAAALAGVAIAVSGRFQGLGRDAKWIPLAVDLLSREDAIELLTLEAGPPRSGGKKAYGELAEALGRLPLALHLAAGHLRDGHTPKSFLAELRRRRLNVGGADPADPRPSLHVSFQLSFELLQKELKPFPGLADAFLLLGDVKPAGIGFGPARTLTGLSPEDFDRLRIAAYRLSLVTFEGARQDRLRIHPLLAEWLSVQVDAAESA